MVSKEMIAAVRAIPMPEYFKEVMPHVDETLTGLGDDLEIYGKSLCPFHEEKTPSFTYFEHTNTCSCFGCGTGGDTIAIHRRLFNVGFEDAVEFLYDHFIGEDTGISRVRLMPIKEQESKAEQLVFNHTVLDRVTPKNFELAEDLSLLIRLGKLTGSQAVEYYKQRAMRV